MQSPASLTGAWLLHASFWSMYFPAHLEISIMRLLLSLAGGAHVEPTMLERCAGAACFQLDSCIKAVLRMMEGSAEGFSALSALPPKLWKNQDLKPLRISPLVWASKIALPISKMWQLGQIMAPSEATIWHVLASRIDLGHRT